MHGIRGEFGLNECLGCNVFYLSPRPALTALSTYYPEDYPQHRYTKTDVRSVFLRGIRDMLKNTIMYEIYKDKSYEYAKRIRSSVIAKFISYLMFPFWKRAVLLPLFKEGAKVLDLGCGPGFYLFGLKNRGYEAYGIEPSDNAAKIGREQLGLNIKTGTIFDYKFPNNYFHLITMNSVLEHIHNPVEVLTELKRILHPDGIITIKTPNMDSFGYERFGKNWGPLETPRHLILYSEKSLTNLCNLAGLQVKYFNTVHGIGLLYWSLAYETMAKKGIKEFSPNGTYSLFQKIQINVLDLYERLLISMNKPIGEELLAVLRK